MKKWQAISEQEHSRKVRKQDVKNCHTEIGQASIVSIEQKVLEKINFESVVYDSKEPLKK